MISEICGFRFRFLFGRQPLADAEGANRTSVMELLKSHGGLSYVSVHHVHSTVLFFSVQSMIKGT